MVIDVDDTRYAALSARDRRFDGRFFTGVTSTGVYCRPVCPARTPARRNCRFFATAAAAEREGFRPCLRCRPEHSPGTAASVDAIPRLVSRAVAYIDAGYLDEQSVASLAERLGVSARHLRRACERSLGASPVELAQTRRLALARTLLRDGSLRVVDVAFAAGFESLRRFNALVRARLGRTPRELRAHASRPPRDNPLREPMHDHFTLSLGYRAPYAHAPWLAYMARHATPGVERVRPAQLLYERVVREGDASGVLSLAFDAERPLVFVRVPVALAAHTSRLVARVRALTDLDADPLSIDAHLGAHPTLAPLVAKNPGMRIPGAFDSFEIAARTILGQQVSMAAANTLCGRLARALGDRVETGDEDLYAAFPRADRVADASLDALTALGIVRTRAEALRDVARALRDEQLRLEPGDDAAAAARVLTAIRGIGPWTAAYITLRALRESDAFPPNDLGLRRALGAHGLREERALTQAFRPFRSYAALHLWGAYTEGSTR